MWHIRKLRPRQGKSVEQKRAGMWGPIQAEPNRVPLTFPPPAPGSEVNSGLLEEDVYSPTRPVFPGKARKQPRRSGKPTPEQ